MNRKHSVVESRPGVCWYCNKPLKFMQPKVFLPEDEACLNRQGKISKMHELCWVFRRAEIFGEGKK